MLDLFPGVILASASPRRQELLAQIGVSYTSADHRVDELREVGEAPGDFVCRLAREKAQSVLESLPQLTVPVLGADTIVVCQGEILGKPRDQSDALRMLQLLSGREHYVYSAVALCHRERCEYRMSSTLVTFKPLSGIECLTYWQSGEPVGKAGAYAIQGLAAMFVVSISGSYSGVVGLPLHETAELLELFGVRTGMTKHE
jgi:septum formation protein